MNYSLPMRLVQRPSNFDGVTHNLLSGQHPLLQPACPQSLSTSSKITPSYQEVDSVLSANVIKGTDMRMDQTGNRPCFPLKSPTDIHSL